MAALLAVFEVGRHLLPDSSKPSADPHGPALTVKIPSARSRTGDTGRPVTARQTIAAAIQASAMIIATCTSKTTMAAQKSVVGTTTATSRLITMRTVTSLSLGAPGGTGAPTTSIDVVM